MEYRRLGQTDIDVSVICLGTMTWGEQNSEQEAHEQLDYALDHGVNFFDTAEMYPVPPKKETYTKTEQYIGTWSKLKTHRDKIILATKAAGKSSWMNHIRHGNACFDRKNLTEALNGSLQRLGVDYIDLYQLHWPDRPTNCFGQRDYVANDVNFTPFGEVLEVLKDFQKEGKVKHFGLSNETPWGTMSYLKEAEVKDLPRMQSIQNPYSLLNRTYEIGMAEVSYKEKCGLLAYSPLGFGVLSGKYLDGQCPPNSRLDLFDQYTRYSNSNAVRATESYVGLAKKHGHDPAQMALAFVNSRPFLTSNIIGATTMEQLKSNIASIDLQLSGELLDEINTIHESNPNPAP